MQKQEKLLIEMKFFKDKLQNLILLSFMNAKILIIPIIIIILKLSIKPMILLLYYILNMKDSN
jgi:hypothetical protein